ncbi:MAG: hypothetical protein AUK55_10195 [Syntrophobacteraceae bacterium CG2_30_61_12]|nr:MAG: hypothetical protein AUK55_10195 [Syntrophobacteraceae bacterium CG2_30_61_12]
MVRTNEYPVARVDPVKKLGLLPRMAYTSSGHEPSFSPQGCKQRKETQGFNLSIKTFATLGVPCVFAVDQDRQTVPVRSRGEAPGSPPGPQAELDRQADSVWLNRSLVIIMELLYSSVIEGRDNFRPVDSGDTPSRSYPERQVGMREAQREETAKEAVNG